MKYSNRSIFRRIIASPITLVLCVVLLVVLGKASFNIAEKTRLSSERLTLAQAEIMELRERQSELSTKVEYLSTDQGIETEIRTKYHAVKDGESVAVIIDESKTASVLNQPIVLATSSTSLWKRFLRMFGF